MDLSYSFTAAAGTPTATLTCAAPGVGVGKKRALEEQAGQPAPGGGGGTFAEQATFGDALGYVMDLIHTPKDLGPARGAQVMRDVLGAWAAHVNPGFLQYRKSVAGPLYAAIELRDNHADPAHSTLLDAEGAEYIDCLGGYGCFNVGRSHPAVVAAVRAQLERQPLHSQELLDPLRAYAAALLVRTLPGDLRYAFFTNSGAESVEHALRFAMLATGRRHFIGLQGAFHGKTLGALSGTAKASFRKPFASVLLPFTHVPPNDEGALSAAFLAAALTGVDIAGVIMEPVLGEGGIHVLSDGFLRAARRLCDDAGAMLIFDEVQSGMGRTGKWWACEHAGVAPDIMAIGKAFGGGVVGAGATVATPKVWQKFIESPFIFSTTFGGNPLACAAAIAAMSVTHNERLCDAAASKGEYLLGRLRELQAAHPALLTAVRGRGLMLGLEFADNETGYAFSRAAFARKIVLSGTLVNATVIRVEPPLTISAAQMDAVVARFAEALAEVEVEAARGGVERMRTMLPPLPPAAAPAPLFAPRGDALLRGGVSPKAAPRAAGKPAGAAALGGGIDMGGFGMRRSLA